MSQIGKLDAAIRAVCPIHGVSVDSWADRQTWRIDFTAEATQPQRSSAEAVKEAFDPLEVTPEEQRLSTDESERVACKLDVPIMTLVNQTKSEWLTWASSNFPSLNAAEKTRLGNLFWVVAVSVRRSVR